MEIHELTSVPTNFCWTEQWFHALPRSDGISERVFREAFVIGHIGIRLYVLHGGQQNDPLLAKFDSPAGVKRPVAFAGYPHERLTSKNQ